MWSDVATVAGLALALGGAAVTANAVIISDEQASELAGTYWDENTALKEALLKQSRQAMRGLLAIAIGTALQIAGVGFEHFTE